ncbi:MAG: hypothetical protein ACYDDF_01980 [Thermoplasmatota archaeon]
MQLTNQVSGNGAPTAIHTRGAEEMSMLLASTGTPPSWTKTVPTRLGLVEPGYDTTLSPSKLSALRNWTDPANVTAVETAVGLAGHSVAIRVQPAFTNAEGLDLLKTADYRVAYVGSYSGIVESGFSKSESGSLNALGIAFTNATVDSALGPTFGGDKFEDSTSILYDQFALRLAGFQGASDLAIGANASYWKVVNLSRYGPENAFPGVSHVLTASNWAGNGWSYTDTPVPFDNTAYLPPVNLSQFQGADTATLSLTQYLSGTKTGPTPNPALDDYGSVTVQCIATCRAGDSVATNVGGLWWHNGSTHNFKATNVSLTHWIGEQISIGLDWHSINAAPVSGDGDGWFVQSLSVQGVESGQPVALWHNNLDYRTTLYNSVIVGSDANQNNIDDRVANAGVVVNGLSEWVNAGGNLIALGSSPASQDTSDGWLPSALTPTAAQSIASTQLLPTSDYTHPILTDPNTINTGDLRFGTYAYMTGPSTFPVLMVKGSSGSIPALTVATPSGAMQGTAVLTSAQLWPIAPFEQQQILSNFFLFGRYGSMFVNFGPTPAQLASSGTTDSAERIVLLDGRSQGLGVLQGVLIAYAT